MLVTIPDCGKGLNLDLLPSELAPGVWSDASNVRFRNGFAQRRKGISAAFTTPTDTPYCLATFSTSTARFLVQLSTSSVFVDDGVTRTDITGTAPTGSRDDRWTVTDFNGVLVVNNGVDDPMYWGGDTLANLATISGWTAGTKADCMRRLKYYLVAISVTKAGTKYPYRAMWSSAADPGALPSAWTAAASNDAGERDLPGIGKLLDALPMGDALIVYGEEGRYVMRWIGGDQVMDTQRLPGKDGILARGCVIDTPKGHVFLTNGDVRIHAGGESTSIAEGVVRRWLTENIDSTNSTRAFLCLNPQDTEVWVCFPSSGQSDCDTVLAWNWKDESWAKFTVPNLTYGVSGLMSSSLSATTYAAIPTTYASTTTTYNQNEASSNESRLIVATSTPAIGLANVGSHDFGSSVSWHVEKTGIALSEAGDLIRSIRSMRPRVDAAAGAQLSVSLATTMNPDDAPSYATPGTYTQGTTNWMNQITNGGRFAAVRIDGADDQLSSLRSYQLDVTDSGARF